MDALASSAFTVANVTEIYPGVSGGSAINSGQWTIDTAGSSSNGVIIPNGGEPYRIYPQPWTPEQVRHMLDRGIITQNEAREMLGLSPLPEGDAARARARLEDVHTLVNSQYLALEEERLRLLEQYEAFVENGRGSSRSRLGSKPERPSDGPLMPLATKRRICLDE
jgi:hypothetical protein